VLEFLQSKHQHYEIADPRSLVSRSINELNYLNNVKYRFTKYNSRTEVNTVSLYCFYCPPSPTTKSATPQLSRVST